MNDIRYMIHVKWKRLCNLYDIEYMEYPNHNITRDTQDKRFIKPIVFFNIENIRYKISIYKINWNHDIWDIKEIFNQI